MGSCISRRVLRVMALCGVLNDELRVMLSEREPNETEAVDA